MSTIEYKKGDPLPEKKPEVKVEEHPVEEKKRIVPLGEELGKLTDAEAQKLNALISQKEKAETELKEKYPWAMMKGRFEKVKEIMKTRFKQ